MTRGGKPKREEAICLSSERQSQAVTSSAADRSLIITLIERDGGEIGRLSR